jgi:hypothetical protein
MFSNTIMTYWPLTEGGIAERLAALCTPSSDISTFIPQMTSCSRRRSDSTPPLGWPQPLRDTHVSKQAGPWSGSEAMACCTLMRQVGRTPRRPRPLGTLTGRAKSDIK